MSDSDTQTYPPMQPVADGPPSPEVQAPSPASVAPPSPMPDLGQPSTATPVLAKQPGHAWRDVVMGALTGLAGSAGSTSFGGGLAGGAGAVLKQKQQQTENDRQAAIDQHGFAFQDTQAAHLAAETYQQDQLNHALPTDIQNKQIAQGLAVVDQLRQHGWTETQIADNTSDGIHSALVDQTDTRGSVGQNVAVNVGGKIHIFHPDDATGPGVKDFVNKGRIVDGLTPYSDAEWLGMSSADQNAEKINYGHQFAQTPAPKDAPQSVASWQTKYNTYSARPDADPGVTAQIKSELDRQKATLGFYNSNAADEAGRVAQAKADVEKQQTSAQAKGDAAPVVAWSPKAPGLNGEAGANIVMTAKQAKDAGLFSYKANPEKVNSLVAGVNDVQQKVNKLNDAARQMNQVTPELAGYLTGDDNKVSAFGAHLNTDGLDAALNHVGLGNANEATRNFIVAYVGAREAITQMPRLQTMGQSSRVTETQMKAAVQMLPRPGDDNDMAQRKMIALQDVIDPIRRQVPKMPGASLMPSFREGQQKSSGSGGSF